MAQAPVRKPALRRMLSFFATGKNQPLLADKSKIDRLYKRHRILIMTAITLGYGIAYMCRLGLSVRLARRSFTHMHSGS
jgi:sugar phosphate permease